MNFYEQCQAMLKRIDGINARLREAQKRVDVLAHRHAARLMWYRMSLDANKITFDEYMKHCAAAEAEFGRALADIKL